MGVPMGARETISASATAEARRSSGMAGPSVAALRGAFQPCTIGTAAGAVVPPTGAVSMAEGTVGTEAERRGAVAGEAAGVGCRVAVATVAVAVGGAAAAAAGA